LYVFKSDAGICFVVVPSITIIASESANVIEDVDLAEPSNKFNSAAVELIFVPPISSVVAETSPATVNTPLVNVKRSVSLVCPIVVPLVIILSTVKVVRVPRLVTLPCAAVAKVPVKVPVTVKLSATVTSEVVCPIVTAIPEVSVAIFKAPCEFVI
jgi:hypothetical protein